MHNVKASNVPLAMNNDPRTAHVATASDHADITGVKFDKVCDLVLLEIKADGVVGPDEGVGIPNSAPVVSDDVWHTTRTNSHALHFEKLVGSLLRCDTVDGEAALDVVQETEVLARFFDRDDIFLHSSSDDRTNCMKVEKTHLGSQSGTWYQSSLFHRP